MSFMPALSFFACVPLGGSLKCQFTGRFESSARNTLKRMLPLMFVARDGRKIGNIVVELVTIQMMNIDALWNRAVSIFPNGSVKIRRAF